MSSYEELRVRKGISHQEVADRMGVTRQAAYNYAHTKNFTQKTIKRLSAILDCSEAELKGLGENPYIGIREVMKVLNVGRSVAIGIVTKLPHVRLGKAGIYRVRKTDVEKYVESRTVNGKS